MSVFWLLALIMFFWPLDATQKPYLSNPQVANPERLNEQLTSLSLPIWQRSRIEYNLGTLYLDRHQPDHALRLFLKISPTDLALPRFGRDLFLNSGIASLQYAQMLSEESVDRQGFLVRQSLRAFDLAWQLDVALRIEEGDVESSLLIERWRNAAQLEARAVEGKQRLSWMREASVEELATLLSLYLQTACERFHGLDGQADLIPLSAYFKQQLSSFASVWEALAQKKISVSEQSTLLAAHACYQKTMQAIQKGDIRVALDELKQTIASLAPLVFRGEKKALRRFRLRIDLFLLQNRQTILEWERLLNEWREVHSDPSVGESGEEMERFLHRSAAEAHEGRFEEARVYLLASLYPLDLLIGDPSSSLAILERARSYVRVAFESSQLDKLIQEPQKAVLKEAARFVPAVLQEQAADLQGKPSCQQVPWEQVIALFDQGLNAARYAENELQQGSPAWPRILAAQEYTAKVWGNAIALLRAPPSSGGTPVQQMAKTFGLIQEMYLEDQFQPVEKEEELHAW